MASKSLGSETPEEVLQECIRVLYEMKEKMGDLEQVQSLYEECERLQDRRPDPNIKYKATLSLGISEVLHSRPEGEEHIRDAFSIAEEVDHQHGVSSARKAFVNALGDAGCVEALVEYADIILRTCSDRERRTIDELELLAAVGGKLTSSNLASESRRLIIAALEHARCLKHQMLPRLLRSIAWSELDLGLLSSALEHAREALAIYEKESGRTHLDGELPRALRNNATLTQCYHQECCHGLIAAVQEEMGNFSDAAESYRRALKIMNMREQRDNTLLNNFAVYQLVIGRPDEAEVALMYALEAPEERELSKRSCARLSLPELHRQQGKFDIALKGIEEVIALWDGDSASFAPARAYLVKGDILSDMGRWEEASNAYDVCEEVIHATLGGHQRLIGEMLIGVGRNLRRWSRVGEAVVQLEKGTALLESKVATHPRLAIGRRELALALQHTEELEKAKMIAEEAAIMSSMVFGPQHRETLCALKVDEEIGICVRNKKWVRIKENF